MVKKFQRLESDSGGDPSQTQFKKNIKKKKKKNVPTLETEKVDLEPTSNISADDLAIATRVVQALSADLTQFRAPQFRSFRLALLPLVEDQLLKIGTDGKGKRKVDIESLEKEYINSVALREKRLKNLEALNEAQPTLRIADGVAEEDLDDEVSRSVITDAPNHEKNSSASSTSADGIALHTKRNCYICKAPYFTLHFFYDQLCPNCAELNYRKRNQSANLQGKYALVTGARVKIGFRVALKLLRFFKIFPA